jgi:RimJ/RimL family protein N-acetyltransferase
MVSCTNTNHFNSILSAMEFDFSWQKTVALKDGTSVVLRYPVMDDAELLQHFINPIIKEDTFLLVNEEQSLNDEKAYLSSIISLMKQNMGLKIFGTVNGQIVGSGDVIRYQYKQHHMGRLGLAISQDYRGKGLGKILMNELIEQSRDILDLKLIELSCYVINEVGIRLYRSMGFVEYGRLPQAIAYRGEYVDQLCFYKEL